VEVAERAKDELARRRGGAHRADHALGREQAAPLEDRHARRGVGHEVHVVEAIERREP